MPKAKREPSVMTGSRMKKGGTKQTKAAGSQRSSHGDGKQLDLFQIQDAAQDVPVKEDISSMEFPIFSLTKIPDTRQRVYSRGGKTLRIFPSMRGAATVFDKDILIYCISRIARSLDAGEQVSRRVRIAVHPFLVGTQRSTGGAAYERVVDMCRRLKGTTIETNVKTSDQERTEGFGLLEHYKVTQYTQNGKGALELELTISDWLYRAVTDFDILTLDSDYFALTRSLDRRLYELARKHCGSKPWWVCNLPLLCEKTGSMEELRYFKKKLKAMIRRDDLPGYRVVLDETIKPNQAVFFIRDNRRIFSEARSSDKLGWVCRLLGSSV
ncbi:MAG: replication initiator protein A [Candidatus Thiodiazotropha lotti]|nr:replication initiator protein A [Candidatus Thiodiazotropha lotti]